MPWTNRGLNRLFSYFQGVPLPASFYVHLITLPIPTRATNTLSELTQIADGNGYSTDGLQLNLDTTDFPTLSEDDGSNNVMVTARDILWTASGGPLPSDSNGARGIVLCDDNGVLNDREVWAWEEFGTVVVTDGQPLTAKLLRLRAYSEIV